MKRKFIVIQLRLPKALAEAVEEVSQLSGVKSPTTAAVLLALVVYSMRQRSEPSIPVKVTKP